MRADINMSTGVVRAEFTLAEYQEIIDALAAKKAKPAPPDRQAEFRMPVESDSEAGKYYFTRIWFDEHGTKHGECKCGDHLYRHNRWCKHLARADGARIRQLARLS